MLPAAATAARAAIRHLGVLAQYVPVGKVADFTSGAFTPGTTLVYVSAMAREFSPQEARPAFIAGRAMLLAGMLAGAEAAQANGLGAEGGVVRMLEGDRFILTDGAALGRPGPVTLTVARGVRAVVGSHWHAEVA